ncbi:hypothetical protein BV898_06315 [Hypsibius exemplaris]|uniref:Uncharacterized protein n=1 Tax=Hypsibius exemplaris TaxID=2072580 RepID=A0A1W0WX84_HYPEX|nr:hypothetical protein BV898_06315 [Hypsibius exemplaris]
MCPNMSDKLTIVWSFGPSVYGYLFDLHFRKQEFLKEIAMAIVLLNGGDSFDAVQLAFIITVKLEIISPKPCTVDTLLRSA